MDTFKKLTRELCSTSGLTVQEFRNLILKYIPGIDEDLTLWLATSKYPDRLKLKY